MKHFPHSPDDMADLLHDRATVPAAIWAAFVLAACLSALFDTPVQQASAQAVAAAASAVAGR